MIIDLTDRFHWQEFMRGGPDTWLTNRLLNPIRNTIIHHTGSHMSLGVPWAYGIRTDGSATTRQQEEMALLSLARDHYQRFGIGPGYYYAGFLSGRFYQVGRLETIRRHTTNRDGRSDGMTWNHDSAAIVLFGNFNHVKLTPEMFNGLLECVRAVRDSTLSVDRPRLTYHSALNPRTECPGDHARKAVDLMPQQLAAPTRGPLTLEEFIEIFNLADDLGRDWNRPVATRDLGNGYVEHDFVMTKRERIR